MRDDKDLLTAAQVAARIQCSEQSVRAWVKRLDFPGPVERGVPHKWSWAAVEAWCRLNRDWVLTKGA